MIVSAKKPIAMLLALGVLVLCACENQADVENQLTLPKEGITKIIDQPGKWVVSVEKVDLSKPESEQYLRKAKEWAKGETPMPNKFTAPEYFDLESYLKNEDETTWVETGEYEEPGSVVESCRPSVMTLILMLFISFDTIKPRNSRDLSVITFDNLSQSQAKRSPRSTSEPTHLRCPEKSRRSNRRGFRRSGTPA